MSSNLGTFTHYSLVIFGKMFIHNSAASCILFIVCSYFLFFYSWQRARLTIRPVISILIKRKSLLRFGKSDISHTPLSENADEFRRKLECGLGISAIIVCAVQTATLLGVLLLDDQRHKQDFVYAYYSTFIVFGICWIALVVRYIGMTENVPS